MFAGPVPAQTLPVKLSAGTSALRVSPDTGAQARAEQLLETYLANRLESLGLDLVVVGSDSAFVLELNFTVLVLRDGRYDVAFVATICHCTAIAGARGQLFDWSLFHEHADLAEVARMEVESLIAELNALERLGIRRP